MAEKKSFVLFTKSEKLVNKLTDEQAGILFRAIFRYVADGQLPEMDIATELAFTAIQDYLDENNEKYENKVNANRENGKKGGRPKTQMDKSVIRKNPNNPVGFVGSSENPNNPHGFFENPKNLKSDTESESVSVSVSVSDSGSSNTGLASGDKPATTAIVSEMDKCGFQINRHLVDECMALSEEYGETWVMEAIRRASESNVRNVRYIHGILKSWKEKGAIDGRSTKDDGTPKKPKYFADEYI